jgi:PAS domain S-box-containing protein
MTPSSSTSLDRDAQPSAIGPAQASDSPAPAGDLASSADPLAALMRQTVLRASEGIMMVRVEPGDVARIVFVNQAFERMTGYSAAEAIGQLPRLLHGPNTSQEVLKETEKYVELGEPFSAQLTYRRKDGSEYEAELSVFPLADAGGLPGSYWVSFQRDATDRLRAERERAALADALEQTDDAIAIVDVTGRVAYVNQAFERDRGLQRESVIGRRAIELRSRGFTSKMFRHARRRLSRGEPWRGRFTDVPAPGAASASAADGSVPPEPREIDAIISPVRDANGQARRHIVVARDVSRQNRLERRLKRAEALADVGKAVANISHQVKNILSNLRAGSQLIRRGLDKGDLEVVRKMWDLYDRATKRLETLSRDMLAATRDPAPVLEPESLGEIVEEIVRLCRPRGVDSGVELIFEIADDLPLVELDREGIYDAVLNIVDNALEACAKANGGTVAIHLRADEPANAAEILIRDNGPGIPDDIRERVFEQFFTTKGSQGTGLGLSGARRIVLAHGGDLTLQTRIGETVFALRLPLDRSRPMAENCAGS